MSPAATMDEALSMAEADDRPGLMQPKQPHFAAKAKAVIWLFMPGSPSQVDTFDYKPELQKRDGTISVRAHRFHTLQGPEAIPSHDFH